MKTAGIITHANTDIEKEVVIAFFSAHCGTLVYTLNNTTFSIDFDKMTIDVKGLNSELFAWEATIEDLDFHQLDFGTYLQGKV